MVFAWCVYAENKNIYYDDDNDDDNDYCNTEDEGWALHMLDNFFLTTELYPHPYVFEIESHYLNQGGPEI